MRLKIYISSTFEDLKEFRQCVRDKLLAMHHEVVSMEDYVAAPQRPLDKCLQDVREADVYVGLFAWRYGHVPRAGNPLRKSVTELEYLEAKRRNKPCFVFLLKPNVPWLPMHMDQHTGENERGKRIEALTKRLRENELIAEFRGPPELAESVAGALARWQTQASAEHGPAPAEAPSPAAQVPAGPGQSPRARRDCPLLWQPGARLRVRMLDGDAEFGVRIVRLAQIWGAYANISFEASSDRDAEVRVALREGDGSWAYEGTEGLGVKVTEPTMNLGWVKPASSLCDLESVVLHEFGHVLGLAHEHNNPAGRIPWNRKTVYESMTGEPTSWTRKQVDEHFFSTWKADRFPFAKPFDPLSIMAYWFPPEYTKGGEMFGRNLALSAGDKEFVSRLYPYPSVAASAVRPAKRKKATA